MTSSTVAGPVLAALLVAGLGSAALAQADPATDPAPPIEVSVDCDSSPERATITNNTKKPVKLKSVGSTFQMRAGEPYKVKKTLKPGKSVSYTFGTGKGKGKRLTGSFIFDNEEEDEGVAVKTNEGRVRVLCDEFTNAPPAPEPATEETVQVPLSELAPGEPLVAREVLATLQVAPEVEAGYERELFEHWIDVDDDGCDTRQEVLIAESLTPVTVGDGCIIEDGSWYSSADGDTLTNPASLDVNHVVPLKEAWTSGAHAWTPEQREAFANDLDDPRTLQAVSSGANRQQGEADPASWLPADRDVACQFVEDWVAIKSHWELAVDEDERLALQATLDSCR